jgi:hypothetical protein
MSTTPFISYTSNGKRLNHLSNGATIKRVPSISKSRNEWMIDTSYSLKFAPIRDGIHQQQNNPFTPVRHLKAHLSSCMS